MARKHSSIAVIKIRVRVKNRIEMDLHVFSNFDFAPFI